MFPNIFWPSKSPVGFPGIELSNSVSPGPHSTTTTIMVCQHATVVHMYVYALLENLTDDAIAYSSTCAEILNDFLSI